ncbi:VC0807 family protein [Ktedonospora formicarum]|uniref:DUF3159 domain-containing protein n=1 Tax=Ktedonospora formicarum TaxID=2778364 RepID=A0A8J3MWX3_9CHLR|nr:VC0807 family protein [Ktedonospora formicarum]GHO49123.1 hypothetical protein KSX_72860 [Ktedonospora formicarum]
MEITASLQTQPETPQKASRTATIWSLVSSILINGVLPFIIYILLTNYTNTSELLALVASGVPPLLESIVGILRRKRIDVLAGISLAGITASLIIALLGGSPKIYLIRESFFTAIFGLVFLVTLLFSRPLMFYFSRHFATGNHPKNIPWFDSLWQYRGFRISMRVMTTVWGIGFLLEAAIRIYLVFALSTEQFLIVSPFIIYGIIGILATWTFFYSRAGRKKSEAIRQSMLVQQNVSPAPDA